MSISTLIDEARAASRYQGETLVIFNRPEHDVRLTLEWDVASERWRGECSDGNLHLSYLAPCSTQDGDDVRAVCGALDAYLDAATFGLGGKLSEGKSRDMIDSGNAWAVEAISRYGK
jgi:hypothetical protein